MKGRNYKPEDLEWRCAACDEALVPMPVTVAYLGSEFTTELPKCPRCGMVLISEELALGKMAEVEEILEDK